MTFPAPAMRERYLTDSIATAPPAKLLMMLYDRLVLDLARGEQALVDGDRVEARSHLMHGQEIVLELQVSLNLEVWEGAVGLARLYAFVTTELINANVQGDPARVKGCRDLIEPLRDTWREAALATAPAAG
jgi:flagellar protein FliS